MPDQKLTELTAAASQLGTDVLYVVVDPAGTPLDRKITSEDLFVAGLSTGKVTGGRTLRGGQAASASLTLSTTSHATKGTLFIDVFGYWTKDDLVFYKPGTSTQVVGLNSSTTGGTLWLMDSGGVVQLAAYATGGANVVGLWVGGNTTGDGALVIGGSYLAALTTGSGYVAYKQARVQPVAQADYVSTYAKDYAAGDSRLYVQGETGGPTIIGNGMVESAQFTSTVATGTPPIVVTSTTAVPNLNAGRFGGLNSAANTKGDVPVSTGNALAFVAAGANGTALVADSAAAAGVKWEPYLPTNYITGLVLSNNVTDATNAVDIAPGAAKSVDDTEPMMLAATLVKRIDAAWAAGTNMGGMDTGAVDASSWYYVWLIKRVDTGIVDVLFSLSNSAPTMPANYTKKRRIGAVKRLSSVIRPFLQEGSEFFWKSPVMEVNVATLGTSRTSFGIGGSVPAGWRVKCLCNVQVGSSDGVYVSCPDVTDLAPSDSASPLATWRDSGTVTDGGMTYLLTSTTQNISARALAASSTFRVAIVSYVDDRGNNGGI